MQRFIIRQLVQKVSKIQRVAKAIAQRTNFEFRMAA
jgi:hypothetical protein